MSPRHYFGRDVFHVLSTYNFYLSVSPTSYPIVSPCKQMGFRSARESMTWVPHLSMPTFHDHQPARQQQVSASNGSISSPRDGVISAFAQCEEQKKKTSSSMSPLTS